MNNNSCLYVCGDRHGSTEFFPKVKEEDIVIIAGDCGYVWHYAGTDGWEKEDVKLLDELQSMGATFICICGNHENYKQIREFPQEEKWGGKVRRTEAGNRKWDNIFWVDEPTVLEVRGKRLLCLPYGTSHDVRFRTIDVTWWQEERGNIGEEIEFIEGLENKNFDYVISHEAPLQEDIMFKPTLREMFYSWVITQVNFKLWIHGHNHFDMEYYTDGNSNRVLALFKSSFLLE